MKTKILLLISAFLICLTGNARSEEKPASSNQPSQPGKLKISSPMDLKDLANQWAADYRKINPAVSVEVAVLPANSNQLPATGDLTLISGQQALPGLDQAWKLTVGREVVVPIVSSSNPYLEQLSQRGATVRGLAGIFREPSLRQWGSILGSTAADPMHIYMMEGSSVESAVTAFLGMEGIKAAGITYGSAAAILEAVRKDPSALAFCRLAELTDPATGNLQPGIRLMPLDKNANGRVDYMEEIYGDLAAFSRGVWIGKYPQALVHDIFLVSAAAPQNESEVAFLSWILTVGQPALHSQGISDLVSSERQSQLDKLINYPPGLPPSDDITSVPGLAWYIIIGLAIVGLGINAIVRRNRRRAESRIPVHAVSPQAFSEVSLNIPEGLYYDNTHTWAFMEKDGRVRVGIDDFLQHVTGPITRVDLKKPGEKIRKGQPLLSIIQKGKQLTVYAPISGTIREANQALLKAGARINVSPYGEGWAYMIEPANWTLEISLMQMAARYKQWISGEFTRLKEFLAASLPAGKLEMAHIVLQDGGELKDQTLAELGPEVWEDFQAGFLDKQQSSTTSH